jgi:hypothetical protein
VIDDFLLLVYYTNLRNIFMATIDTITTPTDKARDWSDASDWMKTKPTPVFDLNGPNRGPQTNKKISVLYDYPVINWDWLMWKSPQTELALPSVLTRQSSDGGFEMMKSIQETNDNGALVFISRLSSVRNDEGEVLDPWNRGLSTYHQNFKLLGQKPKDIVDTIGANSTKYVFFWFVETTLKGKKVLLVMWESVDLAYKSKNSNERFINNLSPMFINIKPKHSNVGDSD